MATSENEDEMTGTIVEADPFDKDADAKALFEATSGLGTKETVITEILTQRTNAQRQDIAETYLNAYDKELVTVMQSELSGHYLLVVEGLLEDPAVFLAKAIHKYAMNGSNLAPADLTLRLLEIILPHNYVELSYIKEAYRQSFGSELEADLVKILSGPSMSILINIVRGHRHDTLRIDEYKVAADVDFFLKTPVDGWALPNSKIESILTEDSQEHLQVVFQKVNESMLAEKGLGLLDAINGSNLSQEQKDVSLELMSACLNNVHFNATALHRALHGPGTDDDTLIRIIVSRCEIDLANINTAYQLLYGSSLRDAVSGDTSGDYRSILLAIIGD